MKRDSRGFCIEIYLFKRLLKTDTRVSQEEEKYVLINGREIKNIENNSFEKVFARKKRGSAEI